MALGGSQSPAELLLLSCTRLQMVPWHRFFDPGVSCLQQTSTNLLTPAASTLGHRTAPLLAAVLWGPWDAGPSDLGSLWDPKGPSVMLQLSESWPQPLQCCCSAFLGTAMWRDSCFPFLFNPWYCCLSTSGWCQVL